jgi:AcrR family transcriptional regulator
MSTWVREDATDVAAERLLDAAGAVFARKGVVAVTVADVAAEAGCARGTVYRCFPDREALRRAFVEREARRVAGRVAARLPGADAPRALLAASVLVAVDEVRADPVLAAWFTESSAATAGRVAVGTDVIGELVAAFLAGLLGDPDVEGLRPDVDRPAVVDGMVRVVLSLLAHPGADAEAERRLVDAVLVPAVFT